MVTRLLTAVTSICNRLPRAAWLLLFLANSALGDIAIIVHPDNPVTQLTNKEVKKIFLGHTRLFPKTQLGMRVLDVESDHPSYKIFYEDFIGFPVHKLQRYRAAYLFSGKGLLPDKVPDPDAVKKTVGSDVSAIGYIDASAVDSSVQVIFTWSPESQEP